MKMLKNRKEIKQFRKYHFIILRIYQVLFYKIEKIWRWDSFNFIFMIKK